MMDRWASRVPAEVAQEATKAFTAADQYIAGYNIQMSRWSTQGEVARLSAGAVPHHALGPARRAEGALRRRAGRAREAARDPEGDGADRPPGDSEGRDRQPGVLLEPFVAAKPDEREPDTRYAKLLGVFRAVRAADPYCPTAPTFIQRKFELDRQIPEKQVEELLFPCSRRAR
jgi:hypothetical protein